MNILIAGDFVPFDRVANQIDKSDFSCFNEISQFVQEVDYAIVNLECPVVKRKVKPIKKAGPSLRCTENAILCIQQAGFDCVTLANNHLRDYGQVGVEDTIMFCQKYGMDYMGAGRDLIEAEKVLYKEINGYRLAFLNVCENEWSIAGEKYGGTAPLNPVHNYYNIRKARENADYVSVIVHGGIESCQYPTPRMVDTYRFFIDAGADLIVNHHQHCFSGYEEYNGGLIVYGLGNLCFDRKGQRDSIWNKGYMVKIQFKQDKLDYEIIPYTQCDSNPKVQIMESNERSEFERDMEKINKIIKDSEKLRLFFSELAGVRGQKMIREFEPFENRIIRRLQKKRLLPSFLSEKTKIDIYDMIRCESHRETLINYFEKYFCQNG